MRKILLALLFVLGLSGCFPGLHQEDVQQGNVITQEQVDKLRPGMNYEQVRFILGSPLITDTFTSNRWDYVYNRARSDRRIASERFTLFFEAGRLKAYSGDFVSEFLEQAQP